MTATRSNSPALWFLILLGWVDASNASGQKLPGQAIASPDGRWQVASQEPAGGAEVHRILLVDKSTGSSTAIDRFSRHAEILWSGDSERVAVTDYFASDESDCRVLRRSGADSKSIREAIKGTMLESIVESNHHAYITCRRWITPSLVEFEVSAYGDGNPKGVTSRGRFDIAADKIVSMARPKK
jgi:hypothetical protein